MEKFTAATFYGIGQYLCEVRRNFERFDRSEQAVPGAHQQGAGGKNLRFVQSECQKLGLSVSAKSVDFYFERDQAGITVGEIVDILNNLERTIRWEMEDRLFMFIPTERAGYYDQRELFGKDVNAKFPGIQFDLTEAGNCYAAGRGTGAVFHLMRIMETGVQEFGNKLGVTLANEKNWQNILDEINKAIKALSPKGADTVKMSQASANLYAVKLAWRNEVMHPKDTYTLEEADNLIRQVRIFMEQLATIV